MGLFRRWLLIYYLEYLSGLMGEPKDGGLLQSIVLIGAFKLGSSVLDRSS
jgi:hypothetical protein